MEFNNQFNGHGFQNNSNSQDIGPKIALWGTVLSALGDTIQVIGGAISIEESNIADQQQQQAMAKLQSQIDDLQKQQSQNNGMSIDVDTFNNVLEKILDKLETIDNAQMENKPKNEYKN
ncbi:hypothetical protein [Sporosarcina sp. 6E9]|uniref:hypothetical protein n=1 Tax=Sporosarcina sp. 6E9 TaxID=2819235 RepID=UPI001AD600F4|nr:hypothetical protein [Sporosarcina sp. 6E9]MBO1910084.1 hypothetical protein [Microvirga sp. 3-52]